MSSQNKNAVLQVVVTPEKDDIVKAVQEELKAMVPNAGFSPSRPAPGLRDCLEFYMTAKLTLPEIEDLKSRLNNDWDGEEDEFQAYGFNTKMFDPRVYYLALSF
jgi:hypothetical protein